MTEKIAYSVIFAYDDPRVLEAQSAYITKKGIGDNGLPIPDWNDSLSKLLRNKSWASTGLSHRHEADRILAEFSFISSMLDNNFSREHVLDMSQWMREVGLEPSTVPTTVEVRSSATAEGISQHEDLTQEAIVLLGRLASFEVLSPEDLR